MPQVLCLECSASVRKWVMLPEEHRESCSQHPARSSKANFNDFVARVTQNYIHHGQRWGQAVMNAFYQIIDAWDVDPNTRECILRSGERLPDIWEIDKNWDERVLHWYTAAATLTDP